MLLRELFEQSSKVAVLAFGRMNPPTIGHAKLVDKIKSIPGDHFLFLSHSQDRKKDPLDFNTKLKFANAFFPGIEIGREGVNTPVVALEYIQSQGYTDVVFVAGSDRVDGFQKLFDTYNGKPDKTGKVPFQFDSITVVSAGERDPDADGAEGMSASKMRAAAAAGDIEAFAQGVPDPKLAQQMYDAVRKSMGIGQTVGEESAILKKNDSDLMNGDVVSINPHGTSAKVAADKAYNENVTDGKVKYAKPQFDAEWEEAERYPEFVKIGKAAWIELANKGKAVTIKSAKGINNTDAADADSFRSLDKDKQARALAQLKSGNVEMPIVAVYPDGWKELIGGNTRLTAMLAQDGKATVWVFRVPDEILDENFADGKVKGKSRPGRVKRAGASCKGSVTDLRKRAKVGGERGKMYHWCANMKSGKK